MRDEGACTGAAIERACQRDDNLAVDGNRAVGAHGDGHRDASAAPCRI